MYLKLASVQYVAKDDSEPLVIQPPSHKCQNYRCPYCSQFRGCWELNPRLQHTWQALYQLSSLSVLYIQPFCCYHLVEPDS